MVAKFLFALLATGALLQVSRADYDKWYPRTSVSIYPRPSYSPSSFQPFVSGGTLPDPSTLLGQNPSIINSFSGSSGSSLGSGQFPGSVYYPGSTSYPGIPGYPAFGPYPGTTYPNYPSYPEYPGSGSTYPNFPNYPSYPEYPGSGSNPGSTYPSYPNYPSYPEYPGSGSYPPYPTIPRDDNTLSGLYDVPRSLNPSYRTHQGQIYDPNQSVNYSY